MTAMNSRGQLLYFCFVFVTWSFINISFVQTQEKQIPFDEMRQWIEAVKQGDVGTVKKLIRKYPAAHKTTVHTEKIPAIENFEQSKEHLPAMHAAARRKHHEVIKVLIEEEVPVNRPTQTLNMTPLMFASISGCNPCVDALLGAGADTEVRSGQLSDSTENEDEKQKIKWNDVGKKTALMYASITGHPDVCKTLLKHGAEANARDIFGKTPIYFSSNARTAEVLIKHGAKVKTGKKRILGGGSPLMGAKNREVARVMLENGADPNYMTRNGAPLHKAIESGDHKWAKLLIDHGSKVHFEKLPLYQPIHVAARVSRKMVKIIHENGGDLNECYDGKTPITYAIKFHKPEILKYLLENGAKINSDCVNESFLETTIKSSAPDALRLLMEEGMEPEEVRGNIIQEARRKWRVLKNREAGRTELAKQVLEILKRDFVVRYRKRLKEKKFDKAVTGDEKEQIDLWIKKLKSTSYETRERAMKKLKEMIDEKDRGGFMLHYLLEQEVEHPEVRNRLEAVIEKGLENQAFE